MRRHAEVLIRRTWHGCEWLGVESMRAPRHGPPRPELDLPKMKGTRGQYRPGGERAR